MKHSSLKLATATMLAVISSLGVGHSAAAKAAPVIVRYACEPSQNFVVTRSGDTATVQFIDRSYDLRRHASSIGEKFLSENAALIIDGKSAVFVAEDRLQLGACIEATRLASN